MAHHLVNERCSFNASIFEFARKASGTCFYCDFNNILAVFIGFRRPFVQSLIHTIFHTTLLTGVQFEPSNWTPTPFNRQLHAIKSSFAAVSLLFLDEIYH